MPRIYRFGDEIVIEAKREQTGHLCQGKTEQGQWPNHEENQHLQDWQQKSSDGEGRIKWND